MSRPAISSVSPGLLAFDLDGTLIPEGGLIVPQATRAALGRLRSLGVRVAVITGRDQAPPDVLDAARPDAVATNNGGTISVGGQLHSEAHFSPEDLRAVLAHSLQDARVIAFTAARIYVDAPPGTPTPDWLSQRPHAPLSALPVGEKILKVGFYHPGIRGWKGVLDTSHPHLVLTGAQEPYTDFLTVTPSGAHKGAALIAIAEALGVDMAHTVAFGDSDNDLAMLEVAGHAVQLGHLPLLRPHADDTLSGPEALGAYLDTLADRLSASGAVGAATPTA
ncbi:HAD hydrolase family protein [Deinococcus altitudinis]|uniref:HAD hydrolase family protein n=1 Tax=Deinococcus altitudinis TaxID=468914 RepID=UPI0038918524